MYGSAFSLSFNSTKHMWVHTGEKTFSCHVCGSKFSRNSVLKKNTHPCRKNTFLCELCGLAFSQKFSLLHHMRIYTGEKVYSYQICGSSFPENSLLTNHMQMFTEEKLFSCEVCQHFY